MINSIFVISLDFELAWGITAKKFLLDYMQNIKGVHICVPLMLKLFAEYDIHATWATVGFLFANSRAMLNRFIPNEKPNYISPDLCAYNFKSLNVGRNEKQDPYHFATSLIRNILKVDNQEIGSHTFSHYYCLEDGQNEKDFYNDLVSFNRIIRDYNIELKSLVFPRNQVNKSYFNIILENGIKCYRGLQNHWKPDFSNENHFFHRLFRFLDSYINLSGHNTYSVYDLLYKRPFNIKASSIFRPFSKKLRILEYFKIKRIKKSMEYAAKNNLIYHLWWHPHNFGINIDKNIYNLEIILKHYKYLNKKYGMKSYNMGEISDILVNMQNKI